MIIKACNGKNCQSRFNSYIITRLKNDIVKFNLENIEIEEHLCMGLCEEGPIIKIDKEVLKNATPIKASEMMFRKLSGNKSKKTKNKRQKDKTEGHFDATDDTSFDENYIK